MKIKKQCLALMAASLLGVGACSNFERSDNGSLDGFWHLTHVDSLESSGSTSADVSHRMLFWSVQKDLIEVRDLHTDTLLGSNHHPILFRFRLTADSLILLGDPKPRYNERLSQDSLVTEATEFEYYGLTGHGDSMRVLYLENARMGLQSKSLRMYFEKR